jgi:DnaJ-class molecular chaperone
VSAVRCAFCKGRGEAKPRTNITCTVCRGTGLVQVSGPIATCPQCRGRGMRAGSDGLPCPRCAGKGFVRGNGTSGERGGLSCR